MRRALNLWGLAFGIAGVIMIFVWDPPQPSFEKGISIGLEASQTRAHDREVEAQQNKYHRLSSIGLASILLGFLFQFGAEWISESEIKKLQTKAQNMPNAGE